MPRAWRVHSCQHQAWACAWNKHLLSSHRAGCWGPERPTQMGAALLEPDCTRALGAAGRPGTQDRPDLLAHEPRVLVSLRYMLQVG